MRRTEEIEEVEDTTAQGGWMYADLFLALMVIFLATVSFVPQFNIGGTGVTNKAPGETVYSYSEIYPERLDIVFDKYDYQFLVNSISLFLKARGIAGDSEIVYVHIISGYDAGSENPQVAIDRALAFNAAIDKSNHKLLQHASTNLSSSSSIAPKQTLLQITFASKVGVTN